MTVDVHDWQQGNRASTRVMPVRSVRIMEPNIGVEVGDNIWMCLEGHENEIPDITELSFQKAQGTVLRAFIRKPSEKMLLCVLSTSKTVRENGRDMVRKLYTYLTGARSVRLLQLRANLVLVPVARGPTQGAADFVPSGLYFDIDVLTLPSQLPADLPRGIGALRWYMRNIMVQDFERKKPQYKQPASRFHQKIEAYFAQRVYDAAADSTANPRKRLALKAPEQRPSQSARANVRP